MDGRKLSHDTLERLRIKALKKIEDGASPETIIKSLGFSRSCIYNWISLYKNGGEKALLSKPLFGRPTLLDKGEWIWLLDSLIRNTPDTYNIQGSLWSRKTIQKLLKLEINQSISAATLSRLLNKTGLESQKYHYRYTLPGLLDGTPMLQNKLAVIKKKARENNAEIIYEDEYSFVRQDSDIPLHVISLINGKGKELFRVFENKISPEIFCEVMDNFLQDSQQIIYLLLIKTPFHTTETIRKYFQQHKDVIFPHLISLPTGGKGGISSKTTPGTSASPLFSRSSIYSNSQIPRFKKILAFSIHRYLSPLNRALLFVLNFNSTLKLSLFKAWNND